LPLAIRVMATDNRRDTAVLLPTEARIMPTIPTNSEPHPASESVWRSPLVPAALALTVGTMLDRYIGVPMPVSLLLTASCLLAWFRTRGSSHQGLPLLYLALAGAAFGAAYHHYRRDVLAEDDISHFAGEEPSLAQLRGQLDDEPAHNRPPRSNPLRSLPRTGTTVTLLRVHELRRGDNWVAASGRVRVVGVEDWPELHCGDTIEVVGQLERVAGPGNPGEFDFAEYLRDQGVRAVLTARTALDGRDGGGRGRSSRRPADALPG
jgi:hypothetical protein